MIYTVKAYIITVRKDNFTKRLYFFQDTDDNIVPTKAPNIILDEDGYAISKDKNLFEEIKYNLFGNFIGKLKYNISYNNFTNYFHYMNQILLPKATKVSWGKEYYFGNSSLVVSWDYIYLKHNIGSIKDLVEIISKEKLGRVRMNEFAASIFSIGFENKNKKDNGSVLSSLAKDSSKKYLPAKVVYGKVYVRINGKWVKFFSNYKLSLVEDYIAQIWVQEVKYHYHRYFIKIQSKNNFLPIKTTYGSKFETTKDLTQNQTKIAEQIISILGED